MYCTHFPAIYFKVGVPSGSVEVIPMWVTYATAEANKTWGLLCSIPCYRSLMNVRQGCPRRVAPPWLSAAGASFCFPGPRTSLLPQCHNSKAGALTASPANEEQGPILGILPIRLVSALGEKHRHLPLRASKRCLWGGPQHVPAQVP